MNNSNEQITSQEYWEMTVDERMNYLNKLWETNDNYLLGKIFRVNREKDFLLVKPIDFKGDNIRHPYKDCDIDSVYGRLDYADSIDENSIEGLIIFRFVETARKDKIEDTPIEIQRKSFVLLEETELESIIFPLSDIKEKVSYLVENDLISELYTSNKRTVNKFSIDRELRESYIKVLDYQNQLTLKNDENIKEQENKLKELERKVKASEEEIKETGERLKLFKSYGLYEGLFENSDFNEGKKLSSIDQDLTIEERVVHIKKHLKHKYGLDYPLNVITRFYGSLCTNMIVLLSGDPGTGKTSLVKYFAEVIGGVYKIIPVQANWRDQQDIIGFFNPIEKYYFSTPFLDALLEAENNPEKIHLICLDEMNLARVEYYFAHFLSILQMKDEKDRKIELYSSNHYSEINKEVEKIIEQNNSQDKNLEKFKRQTSMKSGIKPEIKIPSNVRFLGTLNVDDTTLELSPKVIDRSFIIDFEKNTNDNDFDKMIEEEYSDIDYDTTLYLHPSEFKQKEYQLESSQEKELMSIIEIVEKLGIKLSHRVENNINEFISLSKDQRFPILDYVLVSMILPKIKFIFQDKKDQKYKVLVEELKPALKRYPVSLSKLEDIIERSEEMNIISYWR